jgi:hypothetical protein
LIVSLSLSSSIFLINFGRGESKKVSLPGTSCR